MGLFVAVGGLTGLGARRGIVWCGVGNWVWKRRMRSTGGTRVWVEWWIAIRCKDGEC